MATCELVNAQPQPVSRLDKLSVRSLAERYTCYCFSPLLHGTLTAADGRRFLALSFIHVFDYRLSRSSDNHVLKNWTTAIRCSSKLDIECERMVLWKENSWSCSFYIESSAVWLFKRMEITRSLIVDEVVYQFILLYMSAGNFCS